MPQPVRKGSFPAPCFFFLSFFFSPFLSSFRSLNEIWLIGQGRACRPPKFDAGLSRAAFTFPSLQERE